MRVSEFKICTRYQEELFYSFTVEMTSSLDLASPSLVSSKFFLKANFLFKFINVQNRRIIRLV